MGQAYWRGRVDDIVVEDWTNQYGGARFFGMSPVGRGRTYWFASQLEMAEPVDNASLATLSALRRRYLDFGPPAATLLELLDEEAELHFAPIYEVELDDWVQGSVVLIGDAAHCVSPIAAQGGGMAVEDAAVLADELAAGDTVKDALAAFVVRRRPRVDYVRGYSHARLRAFNIQRPQPPSEEFKRLATEMMRAEFEPLSSPP